MEAGGVWRTKRLPGRSDNVLYQLSAYVDLGSTLQIYADLSNLGNEVREISNNLLTRSHVSPASTKYDNASEEMFVF